MCFEIIIIWKLCERTAKNEEGVCVREKEDFISDDSIIIEIIVIMCISKYIEGIGCAQWRINSFVTLRQFFVVGTSYEALGKINSRWW